MDYINFDSVERLKDDPYPPFPRSIEEAYNGGVWQSHSEDERFNFIFRRSLKALGEDQKSDWAPLKVKEENQVRQVYVKISDVAARLKKTPAAVKQVQAQGNLEKLIVEVQVPLTEGELSVFTSNFQFNLEPGGAADLLVKDMISAGEVFTEPKIFKQALLTRFRALATIMANSRLGDRLEPTWYEINKMMEEFSSKIVNEEEAAQFICKIPWVSNAVLSMLPTEKDFAPDVQVTEGDAADFMYNKCLNYLNNPLGVSGEIWLYEAFVTYWLNQGGDAVVPQNLVDHFGDMVRVAKGAPEESLPVLKLAKDLENKFIKMQGLTKDDREAYGSKLKIASLYLALKLNLDAGIKLNSFIHVFSCYDIDVSDLKSMEMTFLKGINWELKSYLE